MVDTSPGGDARILSEPSPGHVVAGYRLDARKPLQLSRGSVPLHGRREGGARGHALLGGRWCQRCRRNGLLVSARSLGSVDARLLALRALVSPRRDRLLAQFRPPGRHAARPLQLLLLRHLGDEGSGQRVYGIGAASAPHARGRGPRIRERLPLLSKRHQRA